MSIDSILLMFELITQTFWWRDSGEKFCAIWNQTKTELSHFCKTSNPTTRIDEQFGSYQNTETDLDQMSGNYY